MDILSAFMLASVVLTGFLGGIGFANLLGLIPAFKETPAKHIVIHWQILDDYMRNRMPVFGALILFFLVGTVSCMATQPYRQPLWLFIVAIAFILADVIITVIFNFPFNRMVQNITPDNTPADFEDRRTRSATGFSLRAICMIGSFLSTLAALYLQSSRGLLH